MPSKKKHAKESGKIAAAVAKQTAGKFPSGGGHGHETTTSGGNESSKSQPSSDASSPPAVTPEFRPSAPYHVTKAPSPLLDALSTTSVSASTAPSMTNDWAKAGGALGESPGNLINLNSDSPPTQPSSYEDSARPTQPWSSHRPFMSPSPASLSPPNPSRRPLSFQMDGHYRLAETASRASSVANRRSSMQSAYPHGRVVRQPPLPHQPQAHFYGAADLDMTLRQRLGMKAGEQGYFFGFDKLPPSSSDPAAGEKVVVAGYEGGLEVYAIRKRGLDRVAGLKSLRGGVIHAKILPCTVGGTEASPLVAVVIHGPVIASSATSTDDALDSHPDELHPQSSSAVNSYQTAVEVYSLKTNKLVDVLIQSAKIPINSAISITNPLFQPPPPSGAFTINADGRTVTATSGVTGECWIYQQLLEDQNGHAFACCGKLWTCLQQSLRSDVTEEGDKKFSPAPSTRSSRHTPILALNGRWIAYCPPAPSSQISIAPHIPVPIMGRGPGISTMTPPHIPSTMAAVDLPISDSFVNKVMRETTQELIHGAKWVGQQGLQAWNSYWNRSSGSPSQQQQARSPPRQWAAPAPLQSDQSQFPPTHGTNSPAGPKDPGVVSVLDIEMLPSSTAIHPITTFVAPQGCSFLSFSPSSLALFTASSKGDVQTVWDLLRIQYNPSSLLQATLPTHSPTGPQVRQIAQFSRMTTAKIVEVAWSAPQGERLAMVTERGTVHLLDMPFSAFLWPPPRRRKIAAKDAAEPSETPSTAVSIATGALGAAYQAARPFVSGSRRSSGNGPTTSGSSLKDSAAQGGRVIAASISHSLGKTGTAINQLRHAGDNRVALPTSSAVPSTACVTWIKSRKSHVLFALGDGLVRTFPCKTRQSTVQAGKRIARPSRYKDLKLPLLPDDIVSLAVRQVVDLGAEEEILDLSETELEAGNTLTLQAKPPAVTLDYGMDAAIPHAEIESSAPYQPFHTDRRVALCEYSKDSAAGITSASVLLANTSLEERSATLEGKKKKKKGGQASQAAESLAATEDPSTWAFGQDIPVVKLDLRLPQIPDEDSMAPEDDRVLPPSAMERVMQYGDEEQIVVTTRRRKTARHGGDDDGFFEDDCEVLDFADQRV